jgi:hypothetical protein
MWEILPVAMAVIGSVMQGNAAATQGTRQRAAENFEAAQMEQQAGQSIAASQRAALEQERQGRFAGSRLQALAAASGGGTGGNVMDIMANLHAEASYRASIALYQGEERARQLRLAAAGKQYEGYLAEESGFARQKASTISAIGAIGKGGASLYSRYGMGGPRAPVEDRQFDGTSSFGAGGINWDAV